MFFEIFREAWAALGRNPLRSFLTMTGIAWGIVAAQGNASDLFRISRHSFLFLFLSAIATGLSWLFYYKALQLGEASRVAPIDKLSVALAVTMAFVFLGEKPHLGNVLGAGLIVAGVLVTVFVR